MTYGTPAPSVKDTMLSRAGVSPASAAPKKAMTYHLTAEELAQLNQTGTVQAASGCTITADVQGEESAEGEPEPVQTEA